MSKVSRIIEAFKLGSFSRTEPFKLALCVEIKQWKLLFGHSINEKYRTAMEEITQFVTEYSKRLSRPINDLEDVRSAMSALEEIRKSEIYIDMTLGPVEVRPRVTA